MNIVEFTALLDTKKNITIEQTNAVENFLENYPYFQAARMIYLRGLKHQNSFKYNSALKTTAAYTTNRTVLFDFVTADTLDNSNTAEKQKQIIEANEVVGLEVVEQNNQVQSEIHNIHATDLLETAEIKKVEDTLKIGKPLTFDLSEMHSFSEWLQLTSVKPIVRKETEKIETIPKPSTKNKKNFDIIEQFITSKPKLQTGVAIENIDVSFESVVEDGALMTETLARVYLEQKKYKKAIQAFKILSLKYPEKSSFFADRIKAIKFLQNNNA